jgi:hypothetical protein
MNIQIGTELYCNWGAMYPTEEGVVTEINLGNLVYETNLGNTFRCSIRDIRRKDDGHPSPIGVFLLEDLL